MSRKPLVVGNWKMHKTVGEALSLVEAMRAKIEAHAAAVEVAVAPAFTALPAVTSAMRGSSMAVAAQNCHAEAQGAFTGEVSVPMLKDLGVKWVIVGHSERRALFSETDALVAHKAKAVLAAGLGAIVCVGENLRQRETGATLEVIRLQVKGSLSGLTANEVERLVVAYEPVWAIGTGKVATTAQAQEAHSFIRSVVRNQYGEAPAAAMRIQYGGSVKPDNARELLSQADVDGALVGGASLKADDFVAIVAAAAPR
jgi:triosephosphate isomerase (TIM)